VVVAPCDQPSSAIRFASTSGRDASHFNAARASRRRNSTVIARSRLLIVQMGPAPREPKLSGSNR